MYILSIIRSIYAVLNKEQKTKMFLLQLFFAFSAIVQVVGVASIAPFIGIISNPESIQTNKALFAIIGLATLKQPKRLFWHSHCFPCAMIFISNAVSAHFNPLVTAKIFNLSWQ